MSKLKIIGASANCLRDFSVELPLNTLVSITGSSGSGKTTLLRDILFLEWRRRATSDPSLLTSEIIGLPPVFYFGNQRSPRTQDIIIDGLGGRDYIFELAIRCAQQRCTSCDGEIRFESLEDLYFRLKDLHKQTVVVGVPIDEGKLEYPSQRSELRIIQGNEIIKVSEVTTFPVIKALDSIQISDNSRVRLLELLKYAADISPSLIELLIAGQRQSVYLVPTCLSCGNRQRNFSRSLLEREGLNTPELLSSNLGNNSVRQILTLPLDESIEVFNLLGTIGGIENEILRSITLLLNHCLQLGLGYLSLDRKLRTLSSGEFQRVKLAGVLAEQLYGSLVALDEPSSGLSPVDTANLVKLLKKIATGNTVLMATHSHELLKGSDKILELQRGSQPIKFLGRSRDYLPLIESQSAPNIAIKPTTTFLHLSQVNFNNLVNLECKIPSPGLTCLYGISGSGKSTLALQVLYPLSIQLIREKGLDGVLPFGRISTSELNLNRVVSFRTSRFSSFRTAGVVSALGAVAPLRDLYQKTELARIMGLKTGDFNIYKPTSVTAEIRYRGISFNDLSFLSIEEALRHFGKIPLLSKRFKSAVSLGVGHLKLGQLLRQLSAGDEQRLNLASRISRLSGGKSLFILDEPLNGLSEPEQLVVLKVLREIVEDGHTIVAVDHSQLIHDFSDQAIELGPGAGKNGGRVINSKI